MNFDWTVEDRGLKTSVVKIFDETARAEIDAMEEAGARELKDIVTRYLKKLASTGYLEPVIGPGNRSRIVGLMAGQEELAQLSGDLFLSIEVTARLFAGLLSSVGKPDQVSEIVESVQRGELIAAVATTEPAQPGSSGRMTTRAWRDGDTYRLSGKKSFVTNGPIADCVAVVGLVEDQAAVFLVEPGLKGLVIGERIRTLGYNGLTVSSLELMRWRFLNPKSWGPCRTERRWRRCSLCRTLFSLLHQWDSCNGPWPQPGIIPVPTNGTASR